MISNKVRMSTLVSIALEVLVKTSRQEKEIKDKKERSKTISFTDVMILSIENPKESAKKLFSNKCVQQDFKIQGQYTKVHCISMHLH